MVNPRLPGGWGGKNQPIILEWTPIIWQVFCRKLHENEKKLDRNGGASLGFAIESANENGLGLKKSSPSQNKPNDNALKSLQLRTLPYAINNYWS